MASFKRPKLPEKIRANTKGYFYSALAGAVVILVLGFTIGPLTTGGYAEEQADLAVQERDVAYCVARAEHLVATGEVDVPESSRQRVELAKQSIQSLLPEERVSFTSRRACQDALPTNWDSIVG